jgi:hypothetical protein
LIVKLAPHHGATPQQRQDALNTYRVVSQELPAIRAMADSWRKGLAGLLAAVVGFTLIRGRTDLTQLQPCYAITVAVLLGLTLVVGGFAAYQILGAAHGWPRPIPINPGKRSDDTTVTPLTSHDVAMKSLSGLRQGMTAAVISAILLVAAIAITWFGPGKQPAGLLVTDSSGTITCGTVKQTDNGRVTLQTSAGAVVVDLTGAKHVAAVDDCPASGGSG